MAPSLRELSALLTEGVNRVPGTFSRTLKTKKSRKIFQNYVNYFKTTQTRFMRFILHLCNSLSTLKNANIMVIHRLTHIFHRLKPMKKREFSIFSELSTGNGFMGKIGCRWG